MIQTLHTGIKSRLLAILFLLFNCVCSAAPSVNLNTEKNTAPVSMTLAQTNPLESEEGNASAGFSYINQSGYHGPRKPCSRPADQALVYKTLLPFSSVIKEKVYLHETAPLPLPGYYAFLYRFNLF